MLNILEHTRLLDNMLKLSIAGVCCLLVLVLAMNIVDRFTDPLQTHKANWCKFKNEY